jgi:hypothetical protein
MSAFGTANCVKICPGPFWSVSRHQLLTRDEARRITADIAKLLWRSFYIEQSLNHAASAR